MCYSQAQNDLPPFRQPLPGSQPKYKDQTDHSSTLAVYLWDDTLSLSLSGRVLSLFTSGGPHPLSFLISISFSDFWLSGFSPLCLILNIPPLTPSFCLSIYFCPSLSTHLIQFYAFYSPSTLSFISTFLDFSCSVCFFMPLWMFLDLCGLLSWLF